MRVRDKAFVTLLIAAMSIQAVPVTAADAHDGKPENAPARCPIVQTEGLDSMQRTSWNEAYAQACVTLSLPAFRFAVEQSRLNTHCTLFGKREIAGKELLRLIDSSILDFTILAAKQLQTNSTNASTSIADRTMKLTFTRLDDWRTGDRAVRASVVNTIVHEMMHLIPQPQNSDAYYFRDSGHWLPTCNAKSLVSYGVGDLAEKAWLAMPS